MCDWQASAAGTPDHDPRLPPAAAEMVAAEYVTSPPSSLHLYITAVTIRDVVNPPISKLPSSVVYRGFLWFGDMKTQSTWTQKMQSPSDIDVICETRDCIVKPDPT